MDKQIQNILSLMERVDHESVRCDMLVEKITRMSGNWYDDGLLLEPPQSPGVGRYGMHRPESKTFFQNNKEYRVYYFHDGGIYSIDIINNNTGRHDYSDIKMDILIGEIEGNIYYVDEFLDIIYNNKDARDYEIAIDIFDKFLEKYKSKLIDYNISINMLNNNELLKEKILDKISGIVREFRSYMSD
jgi:hypothetical protein